MELEVERWVGMGGYLLIYFIGIDGVKGRFKILVDEFMCLRVDAGMEVGIQ